MVAIRACVVVALAMLAGCAGYYPPPEYGYPGDYRGDAGYGYPGDGYAGNGAVVRCESQEGRIRRCPADVRGGVRLSRQLSRTDCVLGRNWGYDSRGIWVDGGCRGEFVTGGDGAYGGGYGQTVLRCESHDGRERHCSVPIRRGAQLIRQLSRTPCVQGRNWRWDRNGIRVTNGCRAEFRIY